MQQQLAIVRTFHYWRFPGKIQKVGFFKGFLGVFRKRFSRAYISLPGARTGPHMDVDIAWRFMGNTWTKFRPNLIEID